MPASCIRIAALIVAFAVVIFGLIYLNGRAADPTGASRALEWVALYTGAAMAAVMLAFMLGLYRTTLRNTAIFSVSALVFSGSLLLVASQETTGEASMTAMIAHPSLALVSVARADAGPHSAGAGTGARASELNGGWTAPGYSAGR